MARKHKERHTTGKRELISKLMEENEIKNLSDIHEALKDLLGNTIEGMLEAELDEELGYEKYEQTAEPKTNSRNGYKSKRL